MWFGGPHQARQGDLDAIRAGNDGVIALAARHPEVVPIATVHPYDGQAALDELARVAEAGVRVLKIHAHTQGFDVSDPRVEALVRRAGERSEEHTSELQSLMRISYAVFCLKTKNKSTNETTP